MILIRLFLVWLSFLPCTSPAHSPTTPDAPIYQAFGVPIDNPHVGVDYNVDFGTKTFAAMDGIIIQTVDESSVYGRYILILTCDGHGILYAHLSRIDVKFGQLVKAGEVIGLSGGVPGSSGAGQSKGTHLHFEVRPLEFLDSNKHNLDPQQYLAQRMGGAIDTESNERTSRQCRFESCPPIWR